MKAEIRYLFLIYTLNITYNYSVFYSKFLLYIVIPSQNYGQKIM